MPWIKTAIVLGACLASAASHAGDASVEAEKAVHANADQLLWGDTHLHTMLSADANIIGNLNFTPAMAYRFARGERVETATGQFAQLKRPLDFLVVADHAEYFGVLPELREDKDQIKTIGDEGARWLEQFTSDTSGETRPAALQLVRTFSSGKPLMESDEQINRFWDLTIDAADAANDPGSFTALAGFEWTSQPAGNNLHRVVILKDDKSKTSQLRPLSLFDSFDPEHLWDAMADYEKRTGGGAMAIPHNGNLSNGLMFTDRRYDGSAMDRAYAEKRAHWEPVVEVTQIKGDSEAHPSLSPEDEFADFGTWDGGNLDSSTKKQPWMLKYEYARAALKTGLELEQQTGANPYQFGMIGATDSHSGLSTADDDNFRGKGPPWEPNQPARIDSYFIEYEDGYDGNLMGWDQLASGYAAVWATDNSREAIFDALRRREVYATTGPRIRLRFFAGWNFKADDIERVDLADYGYAHGVAMGSELDAREQAEGSTPRLMIVAERDPEGANLDRVQVVKGWLDEAGFAQEKVFDVAWSDDREVDENGKLPAVGNTVNFDAASYDNNIGAQSLKVVWTDPQFDPETSAFYYVRVLEIPTPRWPIYDRKHYGTKLPEAVPLIHQERVYSSPIWYAPGN